MKTMLVRTALAAAAVASLGFAACSAGLEDHAERCARGWWQHAVGARLPRRVEHRLRIEHRV